MSTKLEEVGIEAAEKVISEMKKPKEWTRAEIDAWFLALTEGMQLRRIPGRPGIILWDGVVDGKRVTLFEQDLNTCIVWCRWLFVWSPLKEYCGDEHYQAQRVLLTALLEEHLQWKVKATHCAFPSQLSRWKA